MLAYYDILYIGILYEKLCINHAMGIEFDIYLYIYVCVRIIYMRV
jgi:hypothetical protein